CSSQACCCRPVAGLARLPAGPQAAESLTATLEPYQDRIMHARVTGVTLPTRKSAATAIVAYMHDQQAHVRGPHSGHGPMVRGSDVGSRCGRTRAGSSGLS